MKYETKNGCIRFFDTSGMSSDVWKKILARLNHLNYGFRNENEVKEYFDEHEFLQEDQSSEVLRTLRNDQRKEMYPLSRVERDNFLAKNYFGTTTNFDLAGYILIDGTILCFSHEGYFRDRDHKDIEDVIEVDSEGYSAALIQFMNYGNIRVASNGLDIAQRPTAAQYGMICAYVDYVKELKDKSFYIDISNNKGNVVKNFYYEFPFSGQVIKDINDYFDMITK